MTLDQRTASRRPLIVFAVTAAVGLALFAVCAAGGESLPTVITAAVAFVFAAPTFAAFIAVVWKCT